MGEGGSLDASEKPLEVNFTADISNGGDSLLSLLIPFQNFRYLIN
jgi:hypothetical protein